MTDTTYNDTKKRLETEQDEQLRKQSQSTLTSDEIVSQLARDGLKIENIKKAFRKEEDRRKGVERERDDNLDSYLEERENRIKAEENVANLTKQITDRDRSKAEQLDYARKQRDAEFSSGQLDKELSELSKKSFEDLMKHRRNFRLNEK